MQLFITLWGFASYFYFAFTLQPFQALVCGVIGLLALNALVQSKF